MDARWLWLWSLISRSAARRGLSWWPRAAVSCDCSTDPETGAAAVVGGDEETGQQLPQLKTGQQQVNCTLLSERPVLVAPCCCCSFPLAHGELCL